MVLDLKKRFSIAKMTVMVIAALVMIQVFAFVGAELFGTRDVKLGPAFIIVLAGISVILAVQVVLKWNKERSIDFGDDIIPLMIMIALTLAILLYGKQFVPQIFESPVAQLQAMFS